MKKIVSSLFFYLLTTVVLACTCARKPTVKNSIENSAIVVSAVVLSETIVNNLNAVSTIDGNIHEMTNKLDEWPSKIVKLKINRVYKGQVSSDTLIIITSTSGTSCGVEFKTDKKYIIYGTAGEIINGQPLIKRKPINNNIYWTSLCSRTCLWNKEEESSIKKIIP